MESQQSRDHAAWIHVNLPAIRDNIRAIASFVGSDVGIMSVVKANAYGHGLIEVGQAAIEAGVSCLGVATVDEGLQLRNSALSIPILVLGASLPEQAAKLAAADLSCTVSSLASAEALRAAAGSQGRTAKIHLKLDTGMGRVGNYLDEAIELANAVGDNDSFEIEGIATHIGWTIGPQSDALSKQIQTFNEHIDILVQYLTKAPRWIHAANSLVTIAKQSGHFNLVRIGLLTYGISPSPRLPAKLPLLSALKPALSIHARLTQIRTLRPGQPVGYGGTHTVEQNTRAGIVPVGYGDGYPRLSSGGGHVLCRGIKCPILGTVCMDQIVVDLTNSNAEIGDEVVLLGESEGERITAIDLANSSGRISYEMVTGLPVRLPYLYTT